MWVQISSGRGPEECCLAVGLFMKAFLAECNEKNVEAEAVHLVPGIDRHSFKSVLIALKEGESSHWISELEGTVLWICKSSYRPHHKRKNWFIDIEVYQETDRTDFSSGDVSVETVRSAGPGGQNVNKVESAVRVTHIPTGLSCMASEERSQFMNKKLAFARLARMIESANSRKEAELKKEMWDQHNSLVRGNPVRTYVGEKFVLKK